jgi:hypothetical protein
MRHVWIAILWLGLGGCGELLEGLIEYRVDDNCKAAVEHLKECCPRFTSYRVQCHYYDGRHASTAPAPDLNRSQSECIRNLSCWNMRTELQATGFVCGVPADDFNGGACTMDEPLR